MAKVNKYYLLRSTYNFLTMLKSKFQSKLVFASGITIFDTLQFILYVF